MERNYGSSSSKKSTLSSTRKKGLKSIIAKDFNRLVEQFIQRDEDRIEPAVFLDAMEALEKKHVVNEIELSGSVTNGDIIFDQPAPLPVSKNTLYFGNTKVVLKLRTTAAKIRREKK